MLKIGHRGASAYAPENTIAAFKKAMELGADGIELDLHCCKSGELVVMHDDTLERTTKGRGRVADHTLAELQTLGVPTLDDVFTALGKEAYYFLECKHADAVTATAEAIEQRVHEGWPREKLCLITFAHAPLAEALQKHPTLHAGASFEEANDKSAGFAHNIGAQVLLPNYRALTQELIDQAHLSRLRVIAWTVNEPDDIARLRALGVDGIISDYPDRLR